MGRISVVKLFTQTHTYYTTLCTCAPWHATHIQIHDVCGVVWCVKSTDDAGDRTRRVRRGGRDAGTSRLRVFHVRTTSVVSMHHGAPRAPLGLASRVSRLSHCAAYLSICTLSCLDAGLKLVPPTSLALHTLARQSISPLARITLVEGRSPNRITCGCGASRAPVAAPAGAPASQLTALSRDGRQ